MAGSKFKPQYRRLLFIDEQIRVGMFPSCAALGAKYEVSAKTIQRDVDYLKDELDAPIEYDATRHGLFYRDKTWFLPAILMSEGDILALLVGTQALEIYKGTPVAGELKSIYAKLAQLLPEKISMAPELIFSRFTFSGTPVRPILPEVWKGLIRGLLHQRVTTIEYASPRSEKPKVHTIHPLHMANIEGEWYVLAHETRWGDIAQFAVSRIRKVELKDAPFTPPKGFDAVKMMANRFGKFIHTDGGGKTVQVKIQFSPAIAASIAERSWHPKQKLTWRKDGAMVLEFPVIDVQDIIPWVLSYGPNIQRLAPKSLRDEIVRVAKCLAKLK
jgi:predicted DNA-binding transcriptional regulator YafY